jgi:hypothetical protein
MSLRLRPAKCHGNIRWQTPNWNHNLAKHAKFPFREQQDEGTDERWGG